MQVHVCCACDITACGPEAPIHGGDAWIFSMASSDHISRNEKYLYVHTLYACINVSAAQINACVCTI